MVNFCAVGRDLAQMTDCWCGDGEGEYIGRMDACLSTCDLFKCVNSERDLFYVDNTRQVRGCCQGTLSEEIG